jgi:hypothetical protein
MRKSHLSLLALFGLLALLLQPVCSAYAFAHAAQDIGSAHP